MTAAKTGSFSQSNVVKREPEVDEDEVFGVDRGEEGGEEEGEGRLIERRLGEGCRRILEDWRGGGKATGEGRMGGLLEAPRGSKAASDQVSLIGTVIGVILDCFCRKFKGKGKDKKTDTTRSNDNLESLEGGYGGGEQEDDDGEDWGDWNKPAAPVIPAAPLQKLDDFDGLAPLKPPSHAAEEPDFFSTLGPTLYVPPKKVDAAAKPKSSMTVLGIDDDVDIDLDSWETGNATKKPRKKGLGGTKVS